MLYCTPRQDVCFLVFFCSAGQGTAAATAAGAGAGAYGRSSTAISPSSLNTTMSSVASSSTAAAADSLWRTNHTASAFTMSLPSTAGVTSSNESAEFPFAGANYRELLPLTAQVDALQAKLKWIDHCCAFHAWGQLTWHQLAVLTVGFHPFPPQSILWVRRLVARTSLMLLLPPALMQPPFPPKTSSIAAAVAACKLATPVPTAAAAAAGRGGGGEDDQE